MTMTLTLINHHSLDNLSLFNFLFLISECGSFARVVPSRMNMNGEDIWWWHCAMMNADGAWSGLCLCVYENESKNLSCLGNRNVGQHHCCSFLFIAIHQPSINLHTHTHTHTPSIGPQTTIVPPVNWLIQMWRLIETSKPESSDYYQVYPRLSLTEGGNKYRPLRLMKLLNPVIDFLYSLNDMNPRSFIPPACLALPSSSPSRPKRALVGKRRNVTVLGGFLVFSPAPNFACAWTPRLSSERRKRKNIITMVRCRRHRQERGSHAAGQEVMELCRLLAGGLSSTCWSTKVLAFCYACELDTYTTQKSSLRRLFCLCLLP